MRLSYWYIVLVLAVGLTVGAISGLTKSPVSNTVIETVVALISSTAGVYYVYRKSMTSHIHAISMVGKVGLLFIVGFWCGLVAAKEHRRHVASAGDTWDARRSVSENLIVAEIRAHAHNLGMAKSDVNTAIARAEELDAATEQFAGCLSLLGATASRANEIESVFARIAECHAEDRDLSALSEAVAKSFEAARLVLRGSMSNPGVFAAASDVLHAAITKDPRLAKPQTLDCPRTDTPSTTPLPTELVFRVSATIARCRVSGLENLLSRMRIHAGGYSERWKQPVPIEKPDSIMTLEGLFHFEGQ